MRFRFHLRCRERLLLAACGFAATCAPVVGAETAILECTADAWLVTQAQGAAPLNGLGRELVLHGTKKVLLLNFRTSHIAGWKLQGATLL